jgi:PAS domain S-box-containing protein
LVLISANAALTGSYDYSEVARSVLIAVAASYAALDLTGRVTAASGRVRLVWLVGGATAMGIGMWAMHFKGMLAFRLPVPVEYHWPTVLVSLVVAILASAVALYVASRRKMGFAEAITGSVIMSVAIAGMHFIGMAAMRLPAIVRYSPVLLTFSILLAILFSLLALLMAFDLRVETKWTTPRRLGSAMVMGVAVSGMHYTGMAAANFITASPPNLAHAVSISPLANNGIAIVTLIVIVSALLTSSVDRRASAEIQRLNQDLERRVAERTSELAAVNEALRKEIVERERAQADLQRSEERLRLVIDTLPALVWSKSPDGSADFLNQRFLEYTGLSLREGLGWGWMMNAFHPEDRAEEEWRAAFAAGQPFEIEARLRRADGAYRRFVVRATPLRDELGKVVKWYGITTDIEDRKRAEEQLHQAQEDLSRMTNVATMGELAAAIAHEINQPLTAVLLTSNLALRQLESGMPNLEETQAAVADVVEDATRIGGIISRLRTLFTKHVPDRVALDINDVIQEALVFLRNQAARQRVQIRLNLADGLPPILGDRVELQQVLINLAMNGIEAMSAVKDRPRNLIIKTTKHSDGVLIQIQDSGIGLNRIDRIFEPFFTTKPQGIGMGLSVSRTIIESYGGRLWAEPCSSGAIFQFTVPFAT